MQFNTIPLTVGLFRLLHNYNTDILTDTTELDEETKFMQKLEYLRTQAEIFLKMLNDMRRRLKELSPDAPAAQQYRYTHFIV